MPKTYCPECDAVVSLTNPSVGDRLRCQECDVELEVISADPFDVYFPFDEEELDDEEWSGEDWDDDDYEEEDSTNW
jgi:lysine biosynthesis protein LysW